jgi:hypothetical protein
MDDGELERRLFTPPKFDEKPARFAALLVPAAIVFASKLARYAIGNFADPNFPAPTIGVWEESRHPWVSLPPDTPPKRVAKQG